MIQHQIGRELLDLSQTIEHLHVMEEYYNAIRNRDGDLTHMSENEDHSLRYYAVQHLACFDQITMDDLEDHYLGLGMTVVKKEKIYQILGDKATFINTISVIAKNRIIKNLRKSDQVFDGIAIHEFISSGKRAFFEMEISDYGDSILIKKATIGYSLDEADSDLSKNLEHMTGYNF